MTLLHSTSSTVLRRAALLALVLSPLSQAAAGRIVAQHSGLAGTDHVVDFGANLYPNYTDITNQFPPIVFNHARYYTLGTYNNIVGGCLTQSSANGPSTLIASFSAPIKDVSFIYHQVNGSQPSTFRVLLNGALVDSFSYTSDLSQPNNYFGFTDLLFDELQIDFVSAYNLDMIAFNDPDNTGIAYCFGDASQGACPCAGYGATGNGCASSSTTGARLQGSGNACFSDDTFSLSVSGIPGVKPGICIKGSSILGSGLGNAVGDGLLCTSAELRSQLVFSDVAGNLTLPDWEGQSFGSYPNAANAGGSTVYQWWYRDTANTCSGSGFNFSNAWLVTWTP